MKIVLFNLILILNITTVNAQSSEAKKLAERMPRDVANFIYAAESCQHWAGESGYDDERMKKIQSVLNSAECIQLDQNKQRLQSRYKNRPQIIKVLKASEDLY
jgi:hypothetical protein